MTAFDYDAWQAACDACSDAGEARARVSDRWYLCLDAKLRAAGGRGAARAARRFLRVCAEGRAADRRVSAAIKAEEALAPPVKP